MSASGQINLIAARHDWTRAEVSALFELPFPDLLYQAQTTHRQYFDPAQVQVSTLMSVKTGGCTEDCAYCPQSSHYETGVGGEHVAPLEAVVAAAKAAKAQGATRFCMGAAWRSPKARNLERIEPMIRAVSELGLETCATLGMLTAEQAKRLQSAGLDYYNHNIDTSQEHYANIISTRSFQERLDTLEVVRDAGLKVCCGGILGMGETRQDWAGMLHTLATLPEHPGSVPINQLVRVPGTPLADAAPVDPLDFVRVIAVARILMPAAHVRLSAGRTEMSDEMQALCFVAGANSIFYGEELLTTPNPSSEKDRELLARLGMRPEAPPASCAAPSKAAAG